LRRARLVHCETSVASLSPIQMKLDLQRPALPPVHSLQRRQGHFSDRGPVSRSYYRPVAPEVRELPSGRWAPAQTQERCPLSPGQREGRTQVTVADRLAIHDGTPAGGAELDVVVLALIGVEDHEVLSAALLGQSV